MQLKPALPGLVLLAALLGGCEPLAVRLQDAAVSSESSSSSESSVSSIAPSAILRRLDGQPLVSTGSYRFLESGVLEVGDAAAPLTLTIFTEYHCRYCFQFQSEYFPRLKEQFMDGGNVRLRYVIMPLQKYPNSSSAKESLLCAARQGKGWPIHIGITGRPDRSVEGLAPLVQELELDAEALTACRTSDELVHWLDVQRRVMNDLDVALVPTFFLNDEKIEGLPSYADMRGWIESEL